MADAQPHQSRKTQILESGTGDGFHSVWDALVLEDDTPVDPDLLCAYAEGRLSEQERQQIRAQITRSPRAMELLDGLHEQLAQSQPEPVGRSASLSIEALPSRPQFTRALLSVAAAAMLVCMVGFGIWSGRSAGDLADVRERSADLQRDLNETRSDLNEALRAESELANHVTGYRDVMTLVAASTKERLYTLDGSRRPYMTSITSPQLVAMALADDQGIRGLDDLSLEERQQRNTQIAAILSPAESLFMPFATGDNPDSIFDWVDILVAAGEWEQARNLLNSTELADTPASLNLRAGILLSEAADLTNEAGEEVERRIEDLQQRAKEFLNRSVTLDANFDPAWFNLYQLNLTMQDYDGARAALDEYTKLTGQEPGTE